ncbi:signal peptidase I [Patescibacteria group bacterium]
MENEQKEEGIVSVEVDPELKPKIIEPKPKGNMKQSIWEFVKFFLIAFAIIIPIRMWVAQPFVVSGSSMVPTYENGEYLIIDELSYHFREPARGEVIIFRYPNDPSKFFIKRVSGLPGEKVVVKEGSLYIYNDEFPNGVLIEEPYISEELDYTTTTITLSENEYFVLGDNRTKSMDSRIWGALPQKLIIGRAWLRLWPFNKISIPL